MPIRFFNIRSGEELIADSEPKISALWGSSDRGPNVSQGQDMGWRFAPEVVVEMREIMSDPTMIQKIADRFRKMYEDVGETDVLTWISNKTDIESAPIANTDDYRDDYEDQIRKLEAEKKKTTAPLLPAEKTESISDLEKRVELEERLAAARAKNAAPITTTTTTKSDRMKPQTH